MIYGLAIKLKLGFLKLIFNKELFRALIYKVALKFRLSYQGRGVIRCHYQHYCDLSVGMKVMRMKRILICFSIIWLNTVCVFGTFQIPDYLVINSDTLPIYENPLESYFYKIDNRFIEDICAPIKAYTSCQRGYIAYWELSNDSLFLTNIENCCTGTMDSVNFLDLSFYFKERFNYNKVFADWVSYKIGSPFGKNLDYSHTSFTSISEKEKIFIFEEGDFKEH